MLKRFLLLSGLLFFLLVPVKTSAFSVSPVKYNLSVDPGKTATISLTLFNNQNTAATYKFYVVAVKPDNQGRPIFADVSDEAVNWVKSDSSLLNFKSQEKKTIFFAVKVPVTALPGLHYLALISETYNSNNPQLGISSRAATLVSLTVAGQINESITIKKWRAPRFIFKSNTTLDFLAKNNSLIPLPLTGEISIYDWLGKKVASGSVNLGNNILPQSYRQLLLSVPFNASLPGPYQAQINVVYGLSKSNVSAIATVWYFPRWSIAAIILLFSFFIVAAILKKKK